MMDLVGRQIEKGDRIAYAVPSCRWRPLKLGTVHETDTDRVIVMGDLNERLVALDCSNRIVIVTELLI